jgi:aryl-alcohol dehydrogenase-like predicted oxidoreductase
MQYRQLGRAGMMVSEVGIGTDSIAGQGTYGYTDELDGISMLERAYALGATFFDTAEGYCEGRSEELIGRVLGNKSDVVICTKVGGGRGKLEPQRIRPAAEESLRRLRRDRIDVYLLHNPQTEQLSDPAIMEELEALREDGLIASYGASLLLGAQSEQAEVVFDHHGYTSIQVTLNLAEQGVTDAILPRAQEAGVGIIARVPLGSGVLTGKYSRDTQFPENDRRSTGKVREEVQRQMDLRFSASEKLRAWSAQEGISMTQAALAWVLSFDAVSSAIPGCKSAAQAESNTAASGVMLSPAFMEHALTLKGIDLQPHL